MSTVGYLLYLHSRLKVLQCRGVGVCVCVWVCVKHGMFYDPCAGYCLFALIKKIPSLTLRGVLHFGLGMGEQPVGLQMGACRMDRCQIWGLAGLIFFLTKVLLPFYTPGPDPNFNPNPYPNANNEPKP